MTVVPDLMSLPGMFTVTKADASCHKVTILVTRAVTQNGYKGVFHRHGPSIDQVQSVTGIMILADTVFF